jgi:hypothetical protein
VPPCDLVLIVSTSRQISFGFKLVPMAERKIKANFVAPMLLLRTEELPDGRDWLYEIRWVSGSGHQKRRQGSPLLTEWRDVHIEPNVAIGNHSFSVSKKPALD